ncbi:hypothetical protein F4810DRAFT_663310, partial [Camillea tinctor]
MCYVWLRRRSLTRVFCSQGYPVTCTLCTAPCVLMHSILSSEATPSPPLDTRCFKEKKKRSFLYMMIDKNKNKTNSNNTL